MDIMENLNSILWILFGVLTLVQALLWVLPAYRKNPSNAGVVETLDSFWVAMAVALALKAVWVQPFTIPSGSMEDTLQVGDYILVKKYSYGYSFLNKTARFLEFQKPQRGDIVVFVYPKDPSKDFIKRCRGVAGDVLLYKNKVLYVNGTAQDEPFVKRQDPSIYPKGFHPEDPRELDPDCPLADLANSSRDNFGPVTVLPGHYFMMGDNRDNSWDSRYWGQLDERMIKGKAWFIYWHSMGWPGFLILGSLTVGAFTLLFLLFGLFSMRKQTPPASAGSDGKGLDKIPERDFDWKSHVWTIVICFALAGMVLARTGTQSFQDNFDVLKARIFKVIR